MSALLRDFHRAPGVAEDEVREYLASSGPPLPESYLSFLRLFNGGEGVIGESGYVILWALRDLLPLNSAYEANDLLPGFLLFGSNGGGEAFAFDLTAAMRICKVPFVGMHPSLVEYVADDLPALLRYLAGLED
jgi:hypothetical protein